MQAHAHVDEWLRLQIQIHSTTSDRSVLDVTRSSLVNNTDSTLHDVPTITHHFLQSQQSDSLSRCHDPMQTNLSDSIPEFSDFSQVSGTCITLLFPSISSAGPWPGHLSLDYIHIISIAFVVLIWTHVHCYYLPSLCNVKITSPEQLFSQSAGHPFAPSS